MYLSIDAKANTIRWESVTGASSPTPFHDYYFRVFAAIETDGWKSFDFSISIHPCIAPTAFTVTNPPAQQYKIGDPTHSVVIPPWTSDNANCVDGSGVTFIYTGTFF